MHDKFFAWCFTLCRSTSCFHTRPNLVVSVLGRIFDCCLHLHGWDYSGMGQSYDLCMHKAFCFSHVELSLFITTCFEPQICICIQTYWMCMCEECTRVCICPCIKGKDIAEHKDIISEVREGIPRP